MRFTRVRGHILSAIVTMVMVAVSVQAGAEPGASRPEYVFETQICQVLTNVTDSGLISQTLPGMDGWLQIVHERLDDTELVMDGATLTWNGKSSPDNPRIIRLSAPSVTTLEGTEARITSGTERAVQYMERNADGLFELKGLEENGVGFIVSLKPTACGADNLLDCDFSFRYSWVKDREKIEGVNLEIGRPVLGRIASEGPVKMRLGEWSCYQASADSDGWIYVFVRAEKKGSTAAEEDSAQVSGDKGEGEDAASGSGPKIQVGGSVRVRAEMRK